MESEERESWVGRDGDSVTDRVTIPEMDGLTKFSQTVLADPDGVFLRYFGTSLTYAELDKQATALAAAFRDRYGLQPGDRVAAQLQNIPAFAIVLIAVWKSRSIFVPVNRMLREGELVALLEDSGAHIFVTLESLYEPIGHAASERAGVHHVITTSELDFLSSQPSLLVGSARTSFAGCRDLLELIEAHRNAVFQQQAHPDPGDVAFLTYTSGTTGKSKGAINSHANVTADVALMQSWLDLGEGDVILAGAPLFHITGLVLQLALSMSAGVPLVMTYRFDPGVIAEAIETENVTYAVMPITAYISLLNSEDARNRSLSSLTKAFSGGAPVPAQTVEDFQHQFEVRIHNAYGLTESTSACICGPLGVPAPVDEASGALSVGIPLPQVEVRIVDDEGKDVQPGEAGELVLRGPQVVSGYWNKPEETRAAIREGWFHTGDVFTTDSDGWYYIIDRKKDMIICSGYKVWPREVEDVLYTHPAVREAAVVGAPDPYRGETVRAVMSLRPGSSVTSENIIEYCRERLSAYKVPRIVEIRDELPRTATGKILRRELRSK